MFMNNVLINGLPDPGTALLSMSARQVSWLSLF